MRLKVTLSVTASFDDDQEKKTVDSEWVLDDTTDVVAKEDGGYLELAAAEADYAVPFGKVDVASALLIIADDEVTVKLNGADNDAITVRPLLEAEISSPISAYQKEDQPGMLFIRGRIESVHLSNPSLTAVATVFVKLWGDAEA
jgi:hypothetical protein